MNTNQSASPAMNQDQGQASARKYKFPQAQAIAEAMRGNLATNMANPDAADADDAARQAGRVAKPASPTGR